MIQEIFKTKNYNKILAEFNGLTLQEKIVVLSDKKIQKRLDKISNISFLVNILIDLPYEFRYIFIKNINTEKFNLEYEKIIIEFLKLADYEEFDYKKLSKFENIKDKQILSLIFRKLSIDKLKKIIIKDYCQFINDYAFIEYSKKMSNLKLDANIINKVSDSTLLLELKKRKSKQKSIDIEIDQFLNLDFEKQNRILLNGNLKSLEEQIIKKYQNNNYTKDELINKFKDGLINFNYIRLIELQTIFYNIDDDSATALMKLFFKNVLSFENEIESKYLKSMIYNFRKLNDKTPELYEIIKFKKPFAIINYLNTSIINKNLDKSLDKWITIDQYQKINIKKLNKINRLLNKLCNNTDKIQENLLAIMSLKLYLIFGYENSIELLSGKFGDIDFYILAQLLNNCKINNVEFTKINDSYEPKLKKNFIQFFIGNKKDNNTTIKRMLRGELDIIKNEFSNLYNNFEKFQNSIGNKIHLNELIPLLIKNPYLLLPNEYKLTNNIISNVIKSYIYKDEIDEETNDNNSKYVTEACNFYHNYLEKRVNSSIPRVSGITEENYSYEVLKLDDPVIMTLGYITGCCFRLNGMSYEFLKYCSYSIYARVIVIKNETGEICSMIPIIINGNVIVGNSIETNTKGDSHKVYNALKSAYDDILDISNTNEEKPIIACLVSNLHSNCYSNKYVNKKIFPIRNNNFYTNYNSPTYIVSSLENINEKDFELYAPVPIYFDERSKVLLYYRGMTNITEKMEVKNRVNSIQYRLKSQDENSMFGTKYIICSEDWYLKVTYDGIFGECIEKDPRAKKEFSTVKNYLEQKFAINNYMKYI